MELVHLEYLSTTLALVGSVLNARRKVEGFFFWIASNFGFIWIMLEKELYGATVLFVFYTGVCIYGIYHWLTK